MCVCFSEGHALIKFSFSAANFPPIALAAVQHVFPLSSF